MSTYTITEASGNKIVKLSEKEVIEHYQTQVSEYNELGNTPAGSRLPLPDTFAEAQEVCQDFGDIIEDYKEDDKPQTFDNAKGKFANSELIKGLKANTSSTHTSSKKYHISFNDTDETLSANRNELIDFYKEVVKTVNKEAGWDYNMWLASPTTVKEALDIAKTLGHTVELVEESSKEDEEFVIIDEDGKIFSRNSEGVKAFLDTVDDEDGGYSKAVLFTDFDEAQKYAENLGEGFEVLSAKEAFAFINEISSTDIEKLHWIDMNLDDEGKLILTLFYTGDNNFKYEIIDQGEQYDDSGIIEHAENLDAGEVYEHLRKYLSDNEISDLIKHVSNDTPQVAEKKDKFGWAVIYDYITPFITTSFEGKVPTLIGKNLENEIEEVRIYPVPDNTAECKLVLEIANGEDDIEVLTDFVNLEDILSSLEDWNKNQNTEHNLVNNFEVPDKSAVEEFTSRVDEFNANLETSANKDDVYTTAKHILDSLVAGSKYSNIFELVAAIPEDEDIYAMYGKAIEKLVEDYKDDFAKEEIYKAINDMVGYEDSEIETSGIFERDNFDKEKIVGVLEDPKSDALYIQYAINKRGDKYVFGFVPKDDTFTYVTSWIENKRNDDITEEALDRLKIKEDINKEPFKVGEKLLGGKTFKSLMKSIEEDFVG